MILNGLRLTGLLNISLCFSSRPIRMFPTMSYYLGQLIALNLAVRIISGG